jgi:hypothetical protein
LSTVVVNPIVEVIINSGIVHVNSKLNVRKSRWRISLFADKLVFKDESSRIEHNVCRLAQCGYETQNCLQGQSLISKLTLFLSAAKNSGRPSATEVSTKVEPDKLSPGAREAWEMPHWAIACCYNLVAATQMFGPYIFMSPRVANHHGSLASSKVKENCLAGFVDKY